MSANVSNFILSVNAGSSSLKLSIYSIESSSSARKPQLSIKSSISGLTSLPAKFSYKNLKNNENSVNSQEIQDIKADIDAFAYFLEHLDKDKSFVGKDAITHVCHRVVHGGDPGEEGPAIVNDEIEKKLEEV